MNFQQIQIKIDDFIKNYRLAILGTLLVHAFFLLILVVLEMAKPSIKSENSFSIEFAPDMPSENKLIPDQNNLQNNGDESLENVKNVSSNQADKNKSFDDYYKEVENIVNNKPNEKFVANDYADKRNLAKDYSKENEFVVEPENNLNKQTTNNKNSSKNTYAGNAIVTYNLGGRKAVRLPVPAYQCLGSGNVVIEVLVNNMGVVKSATIISSNTTLNESCLSDAAFKSALISKFAIDLKASSLQKGTINYKFIGQ